jgi:hypothetical protein
VSNVKTTEPHTFTAGETVVWSKAPGDYSASDGWALSFHLRGPGQLDQTAEAQDDGSFLFTLTAAQTAELAPGSYYWQTWAVNAGEKAVVASGRCAVAQGLAENVEAFDGRSEVKKTLDAIDALLAGKASLDQQEYQINNRSLRRIPIPDLLELRKYFASLYGQERRRERVKQGRPLFQTINVRFHEPR